MVARGCPCGGVGRADVVQERVEPLLGGHVVLEAQHEGGVAQAVRQALPQRLPRAVVVREPPGWPTHAAEHAMLACAPSPSFSTIPPVYVVLNYALPP